MFRKTSWYCINDILFNEYIHVDLLAGHSTIMKMTWICDMARLLRGTFVSWWYLPRIWPFVTDMRHYYHARCPTDDWHLAYMFSLVYISIVVCLEGVCRHSVSTWRDPCVFIIIVQFMMNANSRIRFGLQIRLFVNYTISLSSLCKLTYDIELIKCLSDIYLSSV